MTGTKAVFDCELIGEKKPRFLCCIKTPKEKHKIWLHQRGSIRLLNELFTERPDLTFVGFNSESFDRPLIAAALMGHDERNLKIIAETIVREQLNSWNTYKQFRLDYVEYDHIDLINVAPGVMISLKTYAGRMSYKTMVDMPFHHNTDLTTAQLKIVEEYCWNDIGVTEELLRRLSTEIALREEMSLEHGIDLRSKSDAQMAEAVLKKAVGLSRSQLHIPLWIKYNTPKFIKTASPKLKELIALLNEHQFKMNQANGSPIAPDFIEEPLRLRSGTYQCGIGGLHSTHDNNVYLESDKDTLLSDFDVASYYPNIMMKAGLIPKLGGNKGELFLNAYKDIYDARMEAKRAGNKKVANSLKITLNGTFGKLGNIYCSFYTPDLMLAVTITGQLNLLCLIDELEKLKGVYVKSANTDGVLVSYPKVMRKEVLQVFVKNAKRTGFEYEETPYRKIGIKDVNNYVAITDERMAAIVTPEGHINEKLAKKDVAKRKGLYASNQPEENPLYLMKNPTMEVCTNMAVDFLRTGIRPEEAIKKYQSMRDFVAIRNVKGGGIQFDSYVEVDDWVKTPDGWIYPGKTTKPVKRVSRPPKRLVGAGGKPFGRVARWYMTTTSMPALSYVSSGNQVPKTEGARICMTLPDKLPKDLDTAWYVAETYRILRDLGLTL